MNTPQHAEYNKRLNRVLDHINANIGEELRLEHLADIADFSPFHFQRIFSAIVGESPRDYIERIRLERSANLLLMGIGATITEIALQCGFSSHAAFARSFKKKYLCSAKEFKKQLIQLSPAPGHAESIEPAESAASLPVTIRRIPPLRLAFVRCMSGYEKGVLHSWKRLLNFAEARGLVNETTWFVGIPYDNPDITPRDRCRYYAGISVAPDVHASGEIGIMDFEGCLCAAYHFEGKLGEIPKAYHALFAVWLPQSGFIPDDRPLVEIYPPGMYYRCIDEVFAYDIALPVREL